MAMEIDDLYPDTPFTEEENETLEKLQGNEYTAEYFYLQLKKNKMYTDYLFKCAHPEDETNADIEKIVLDLRAALDYMSLALIDMKYFDFDKAPDSFKFENMERQPPKRLGYRHRRRIRNAIDQSANAAKRRIFKVYADS